MKALQDLVSKMAEYIKKGNTGRLIGQIIFEILIGMIVFSTLRIIYFWSRYEGKFTYPHKWYVAILGTMTVMGIALAFNHPVTCVISDVCYDINSFLNTKSSVNFNCPDSAVYFAQIDAMAGAVFLSRNQLLIADVDDCDTLVLPILEEKCRNAVVTAQLLNAYGDCSLLYDAVKPINHPFCYDTLVGQFALTVLSAARVGLLAAMMFAVIFIGVSESCCADSVAPPKYGF